jgi:hypothetical protein
MESVSSIIIMFIVQSMSSDILSDYISNIKQQTEIQKNTFVNTLNLIPNGVLLLDVKTKQVVFSNKAMMTQILGLPERPTPSSSLDLDLSSSIKHQVSLFQAYTHSDSSNAEDTQLIHNDCQGPASSPKNQQYSASSMSETSIFEDNTP